MDPSELIVQLKQREAQIEEKLNHIIQQNLDPFPFERIAKAKKLLSLIFECITYIKDDEILLAGMRLRDLEMEGLSILKSQEVMLNKVDKTRSKA
jgi:hypothetical protein